MTHDPEQWKNGGDCKWCRRVKYCRKECRAHKMWRNQIIGRIIREKMGINQIEDALHRQDLK